MKTRSFEEHLVEAYKVYDYQWSRNALSPPSSEDRRNFCEIMAYFAMLCEKRVQEFVEANAPSGDQS